MNSASGTYLEGLKAAFVAFCGIKDVVPSHVAAAMRSCDLTPSDLDNDPVIVAVLERDRETKQWLAEERAKLPEDYDTRKSM